MNHPMNIMGSPSRSLPENKWPGMDEESAVEALLKRAEKGDSSACDRLLAMHRERLKRMVHVRIDNRLRSRVDPSDVVQEALVLASSCLPDYARIRPIPFYPWLRRLAWERMVAASRHHIASKKRSVVREDPDPFSLSNESVHDLAGRLAASGTSPSGRLNQQELHERIRAALLLLESNDREVLVLRYLEQLSTKETAAVLAISEGGVKSRLTRALVRLRASMGSDSMEPKL